MAVKTQTFHIAVCDVTACGAEFDEAGDYRYWDDTPEAALDQVICDPDLNWTLTADKRVICPRSDQAHDAERGGESPALLKTTRDATAVRFDDANWVADVLGATVISIEEAA